VQKLTVSELVQTDWLCKVSQFQNWWNLYHWIEYFWVTAGPEANHLSAFFFVPAGNSTRSNYQNGFVWVFYAWLIFHPKAAALVQIYSFLYPKLEGISTDPDSLSLSVSISFFFGWKLVACSTREEQRGWTFWRM